MSLADKYDYTIIDEWDAIINEIESVGPSILITDLNFLDYFPSVVFDNMLEFSDKMAIIILIENLDSYFLYRDKADALWEILPISVVEDERFSFLMPVLELRFQSWANRL